MHHTSGHITPANLNVQAFVRRVWVVIICVLLIGLSLVKGQSISVTGVSPNSVCAGSTVTITFSTTSGNGAPQRFDNSTVYTVYLSNSSGGAFAAVGSTFSTTGVSYTGGNFGVTTGITTTITIPTGTPTGSGYQISLGSTNPTFIGSAGAGASPVFTVNALPAASISYASPFCTNVSSAFPTINVVSGGPLSATGFSSTAGLSLNLSTGEINPSTSTPGTYTIQYSFTGASGCVNSASTSVTINSPPTVANAGPDQTGAATCGLTSVTLAANTPVTGSGSWSIISGVGGTITTPASPTSTFTGIAGNSYILRWTISNAPCTSSTDDVNITFNQNPTTANAGPDQTGAATCGLTTVPLAANTPAIGTGSWSIIAGAGGTINTPSSPTSTFTGVAGNTYTLRWTISNAPCTSSSDDVLITFNQNPTAANAGVDQTGIATCGLTSVTLAANTPTVGTGSWSIIAGVGGSVTTPANPTSTFSGVAGNTYTLRWTITNAPCGTSTDDVVITFNRNPTTANAGADQTGSSTCGLTSVTLAANTPAIGTGSWSIIAGAGGNITTPSSPTSTFTGVAGNSYTLRWTISNAPCNASIDDVVITFNQNPTITAQPVSQSDCKGNNVDFSAAYSPAGTVTYQWQSNTGAGFNNIAGASGSTSSSPITYSATNIGVGGVNLNGTQYRIIITDANGCSATSSAATLTVNEITGINPIANNVTICEGDSYSYTVTTSGSVPQSYQWTKDGVSLTNNAVYSGVTTSTLIISNATIAQTGSYKVTVVFPITVPNNNGAGVTTCSETSSSLTRNLVVNSSPLVEAGGPDNVCQSSTPAAITLSGASISGGATTGSWAITSGGGTLSSTAVTANPELVTYTPAANFTGTVTLTLTSIDPAGPCVAGSDTRTINIKPTPSAPSATGFENCLGPVTIDGSDVSGCGGTYTWYNVSSGGSPIATGLPFTSTISGDVTYYVSCTVNGCEGPRKSITITTVNVSSGSISASQVICSGTIPAPFTGTAGSGPGNSFQISYQWQSSTVSSTGPWTDIAGATGQNYTPTAAIFTTTYYQRKIIAVHNGNNGTSCEGYAGPLTVTVTPPTVVAGGPDAVCQSSAPAAIPLTGASFGGSAVSAAWSLTSGSGTLSSTAQTASPQTVTFTPAPNFSGTVTLTLTTNPAACASATAIRTITVNPLPVISGTLNVCMGSTSQLTATNTPAAVNPWVSSNTGVATINNSGLVTPVSAGTTTITYTDNNGCITTATVTVNALPVISGTLAVCVGSTTQLTGSGTPAAVNPWVSASPAIATVNNTGLVTGMSQGTSIITFTNNNGCKQTATVTVNPKPAPVITHN